MSTQTAYDKVRRKTQNTNILYNHKIHDFSFLKSAESKNNNHYKLLNIDKVLDCSKNKCEKNHQLITPEILSALCNNISLGYSYNGLVVAFPHIIPDNSSELCAVLFDKLLYLSTTHSNKPLRDLQFRDSDRFSEVKDVTKKLSYIDPILNGII